VEEPLKIDVITVFPAMFKGFLEESIVKRAASSGRVAIRTVDLRDFSTDRRRTVDDKPFGGGPGMLMKCDVWFSAIEQIASSDARVILTSPAGKRFTQKDAEELSHEKHLVFLCGHYEGIDERVKRLVTDEYSIGDFVLTGGEIPAAAMVDSITRLLPGVLGGGPEAAALESFGCENLLEAPQYTRPVSFRGMEVPKELYGGNHAEVEAWRRRQAVDLTVRRRPDLISGGGTFAAGM
jgi:tRNA (guanine37-N1)-methyltransferase